jgi:hypothetical protein
LSTLGDPPDSIPLIRSISCGSPEKATDRRRGRKNPIGLVGSEPIGALALPHRRLREPEQASHSRLVLDRQVQIAARNAHVRVAGGIANLGQRPAAAQRVADECVATVVNGLRFEPGGGKNSARRAESLSRSD